VNANLLIKRLIGRTAGLFPRSRARRVVLLYHSVGDTPWGLPAAQFRDQVRWLAQHATLRSVDDLLGGELDAGLQVAITFDDGYSTLRDVAFPILDEVGAKPCVYLNTGWIHASDRRPSEPSLGHYPGERFLSWRDVGDLAAGGWTIGSHGADHLDLTKLPEEVVRPQLADSKAAIEARLGGPCEAFAYTWGRSTPRLRELTSAAGYRHAMSGRHGPVTKDFDAMAVRRINIANDFSLADFRAVVRGDWDYLGAIQAFRAARAG
jgi:peptidoglycan/xylan/chitin deacetylase (PgdA/CDA1 family)